MKQPHIEKRDSSAVNQTTLLVGRGSTPPVFPTIWTLLDVADLLLRSVPKTILASGSQKVWYFYAVYNLIKMISLTRSPLLI